MRLAPSGNRIARLLLAAPFLLGGCASVGVGAGPRTPDTFPGGGGAEEEYRGVPGFDTREYPGDGVMAHWRERSPYRWVGYYLPAPCYTGTSWVGKRAALRDQGWGLAVVYVGEQDWRSVRGATTLTDSTAAEKQRCTSDNLTTTRGAADGADAATRAAADGFPTGTTLFLDVENVASVSPELGTYVETWTSALLDDGRYRPGLYAHDSDARPLLEAMADAMRERGVTGAPALWVATSSGFDLHAAPSEAGVAGATAWQGAFDVDRKWGDVTLRIDENVAVSASPGGS